tara:strand:+ start:4769 stop:5116 length:348 start_codon:yes stop_codon:yes gene_type:complete
MADKKFYAVNVNNYLRNYAPASAISVRVSKDNNITSLFEKTKLDTHYAAETKCIASIYVTNIEEAITIQKEIEETRLYPNVEIVCEGKVKDNFPKIYEIINEPENHHVNLEDFLA